MSEQEPQFKSQLDEALDLSMEEKRDQRITGFRLITGEFIVGEMATDGNDVGTMTLVYPLTIEPRPQQNGEVKLGLGLYCPFAGDQSIVFNIGAVQSVFKPQANILDSYKGIVRQLTTGLVVAPKKILLG